MSSVIMVYDLGIIVSISTGVPSSHTRESNTSAKEVTPWCGALWLATKAATVNPVKSCVASPCRRSMISLRCLACLIDRPFDFLLLFTCFSFRLQALKSPTVLDRASNCRVMIVSLSVDQGTNHLCPDCKPRCFCIFVTCRHLFRPLQLCLGDSRPPLKDGV